MSKFQKGDRVAYRLHDGQLTPNVGIAGEVSTGGSVHVRWPSGATGWYDPEELVHEVPTATTRKVRQRSTTLTTAEELINGDRAATYGDPAENFGRIADLWNAQFGHKLSAKFTATDVALALVHLKLSRLAVTPDHADSWVDGCGYLALGSELAT
ncbi:DUF6378 domain-containing protein [Paeniglutamicibacter gangotriensis]|uniref:DUF6378 domain-containing protein n=1 Tax=Paeniglutamicibacter gangotriensis TaxID=254787 RepID=UPI0037CB29EF